MKLSTATLAVEDAAIVADLACVVELPAPGKCKRVGLAGIASDVFQGLAAHQRTQPIVRFAYSVKTNPDPILLNEALRAGFFAEVISPAELDHATACGFPADAIVYNGPYPAHYASAAPAIVFADSLEAYRSVASQFSTTLVGLRIRPDGIRSRFGIPRERLGDAATVLRACGRREFGVAFHVRPQDYAGGSFRSVAASVIRTAAELERTADSALTVFDVGGGKRPDEMEAAIAGGEFEWLEREVRTALPRTRLIIAEPGQALATPCAALVATILETRRRGSRSEIVVDAGYPDLPQIGTFEHRFFVMDGGRVSRLRPGRGRIVGRTCLEYDVLATDLNVEACVTGAAIAVADCGAYDTSMAFDFARGAA